MKRFLTALVVAVTAASAATADDKPLDGDLKKLQGQWTAKAGPDAAPVFLTFDKNTIAFRVVAPSGEEKIIAGDFTIDEKAAPKAMSWSNMKIGRVDAPGTEAIYAFDGDDALKIAGGGKDRPKEFIEKGKALPGIRPNTMNFTRVKDEPKK